MFSTETTKCSCGCCGNKCRFNPCAVTCGQCVESFGDYAYIYNTAAQTVAADAAVTFSSNGPLSGTITHTAGTAQVVIGRTGVYMVNYYIDGGDTDTTTTVYRNGEALQGTTYTADNGQFIFAAQTGDVLTLVNTGAAEITLTAEGTTPEAVTNASMTIVRLF
ncbi:MAG: hypothetical protein IJT79_00445 [Ruminococcus sp.]|nr:hypothetical protein [Ruminococcus sp.]